jgi:DNA-binding NarL/FixJ family response regulator
LEKQDSGGYIRIRIMHGKVSIMSIRVLIIDDHPLVRQGLRRLLESRSEFVICGEAVDYQEILPLVERELPDVMVIDLSMLGLKGFDLLEQVSQRFPGTRVVVLSMLKDDVFVLRSLRHGATGYVLKDADPSELIQAILDASDGRRYISPALKDKLIDGLIQQLDDKQMNDYESLTNREREILQLTVEGETSTEIAARLSISPRTVEQHRFNFMRKLGLQNQAELIRYAIKRGIIPLDDL